VGKEYILVIYKGVPEFLSSFTDLNSSSISITTRSFCTRSYCNRIEDACKEPGICCQKYKVKGLRREKALDLPFVK